MRTFTLLIVIAFLASQANGAVVEYNTEDRDQWFADVGGLDNVSIVDFVGFEDLTPISNQWAHLGVNFTGDVFTSGESNIIYPNDGWGCEGYPDINVTFDEPINWIGVDMPGGTTIQLYINDQFIHQTIHLGGSGTGFFGGIISDEPFNRVRFSTEGAHAEFLDDIYFGPVIAIPTPASILALGIALLLRQRRRR